MFSRILGVPLLLGAAVAIPYVKSNGTEGLSEFWKSTGTTSGESSYQSQSSSSVRRSADSPRGPGAELYPVETPLEGIHSHSQDHVFRFDLITDRVY